MDREKAEFRRLIELLGWSQTETARRLHKTPSAINHLVNPEHPNQPTQTMMQLLKLIIASERPDLINPRTNELRDAPVTKMGQTYLNPKERGLIEAMRLLSFEDQEKLYAIIEAFLRAASRTSGRRRK
jgi:transcriptional regulator with XRE-family HTH domain